MKLKGMILRLMVAGLMLSGFTYGTWAADKTTSKTKSTTKATPEQKIDINTATPSELQTLPGVGKATANKIISNRPYSSVADLKKAGLSSKAIQKIEPLASARQINEPSGTAATASQAEQPATRHSRSRATTAESKSSTPDRTSISKEAAGAPTGDKVWVNTDSKVYHHSGDRWYGNTKNGKYMTEREAEAAGYRESKQGKEK